MGLTTKGAPMGAPFVESDRGKLVFDVGTDAHGVEGTVDEGDRDEEEDGGEDVRQRVAL